MAWFQRNKSPDLAAAAPGFDGAYESAVLSGLSRPGDRADVITDGQIHSRAWRFNDPAVKQLGTPSDAFLQQINPKQLSLVMPGHCLTRWTQLGEQFTGRIDPTTCVLQSKYKNEKRRLFSEEIIFPSGSWFREGAYGEDGSLAFGLEEGYYVRLNRLPTTKP